MRDLATIRYENAYAASVEEQKAGRIGAVSAVIAEQVWPSDAPAVPRRLNTLKLDNPEVYALKAWNRRLALLRSAQRRKLDARSRVQACAARVLGADSLANRQALVRALAAEAEL